MKVKRDKPYCVSDFIRASRPELLAEESFILVQATVSSSRLSPHKSTLQNILVSSSTIQPHFHQSNLPLCSIIHASRRRTICMIASITAQSCITLIFSFNGNTYPPIRRRCRNGSTVRCASAWPGRTVIVVATETAEASVAR